MHSAPLPVPVESLPARAIWSAGMTPWLGPPCSPWAARRRSCSCPSAPSASWLTAPADRPASSPLGARRSSGRRVCGRGRPPASLTSARRQASGAPAAAARLPRRRQRHAVANEKGDVQARPVPSLRRPQRDLHICRPQIFAVTGVRLFLASQRARARARALARRAGRHGFGDQPANDSIIASTAPARDAKVAIVRRAL